MTKRRRDAAELAALVEQGVSRGLDIVDAFRAVTGRGAVRPHRTLAIEHKRAVEANRRSIATYKRHVESAKARATGGAVVAGVSGTIGLIDVATFAADPGVPGPSLLWFAVAGVSALVSVRARLRLRRIGPEPHVLEPVAPPPGLPNGRVGSTEIARLTSVRVQVLTIAPALDRLYPGSGDELRRADTEAAGPLTALAERLVILDQLQRELPGTNAAAQAAASAELVRVRLGEGCATYDELLAAAARLLSAPDVQRSTAEVLTPAVNAMIAYSAGLQRLADL